MIRTFSGDPFLAGRAFRSAIAAAVAQGIDVRRLGEGIDASAVRDALAQGGLFGASSVAIDLDEAFAGGGAAATAPRNAVIDAVEGGAVDGDVFLFDSGATAARQKRYRAIGELEHEPTPRYANVVRWVRGEIAARGLTTAGDVAGTLADLFGDDLAAIASEIAKLRALGTTLSPDDVRRIANRPATRSAFDLVDAVIAGDAAASLRIARALVEAGEPPVRVMATLGWQLDLIAGCVAIEAAGGLGVEETARVLKANAFPVRKALAVAARLDERSLRRLVDLFVRADERIKGGGDPEWILEACVLSLAHALEVRARTPSVRDEVTSGRARR